LILLGQDIFGYESLIFPLFLMGMFLYIVFGCYNKFDFLKYIKESSRDVGIAVMAMATLLGFAILSWTMLGTMFILLSVITLFMDMFEDRKWFKKSKIASWAHGVTLGLAVVFYYDD